MTLTILAAWLFLAVVVAWVFSRLKRQEAEDERARQFADLVVACRERVEAEGRTRRAARYECDGLRLVRCLDTAARDIAIAKAINATAHPLAHVIDTFDRRTSWRPRLEALA